MTATLQHLKNLPRIAFVGKEGLTPYSDTGQMLTRHFSNYPKERLIDIHFRAQGSEFHFSHIAVKIEDIRNLSWRSPALTKLNARLAGGAYAHNTSLLYKNNIFSPLDVNWKKFGGPPDIIYSTCSSAQEFAFLHHVFRNLPNRPYIVQHFTELDLSDYTALVGLFRELTPAMGAIWAQTMSIYHAVNHFSPVKAELVQGLHRPLPKTYKLKHRSVSTKFQPIVAGGICSVTALQTLSSIWAACRKKFDLPPVRWVGAAKPFRTKSASIASCPTRLTASAIQRAIQSSDIGLIPLTGEYNHLENHAAYTLPLKLGDYCAHGVPVVAISHKDTAVRQIIEEYELGIVIDPSDMKSALRLLGHFILDADWRKECGLKARHLAEREFDLRTYQAQLYPRLRRFDCQINPKKIVDWGFLL